MTMIQLIACAGMITGFFFLLHLRPVEFTDELFAFLLRKPDTLKEEINQNRGSRGCFDGRLWRPRRFW